MFFRLTVIFFIFISLLLSGGNAYAQNTCDSSSPECVEIGEWNFGISLGLGTRTNPIIDGDDIPLVLIPSFSYYGENFFIDNLDIGYTLIDSPTNMLNLIVTPGYDRVFFERWDISNIIVDFASASSAGISAVEPAPEDNSRFTEIIGSELKKREFTMLGGIEYTTQLNQGELQFNLLKDIGGVHSGSEIRVAYAYPFSKTGVVGTFGLTWKDQSLTDYYYGVDQDEIVDDRGFYQPGASLNPFVRFNWEQEPSEEGMWRIGFEYQKLDSAISNSPIVDKDHVITIFIGKQYNF